MVAELERDDEGRVTASRRPLARDEIAYLERYNEAMAGTRQSTLITAGLIGLPVGFVAFTVTSGPGSFADRLALFLAASILAAFIAGVLNYGRAPKVVFPAPRDLWRLRGLSDDIASREASLVRGEITAKTTRGGNAKEGARKPMPRQYYITVGRRKYELAGSTWLSLGVGQVVLLAVAPRTRVVLVVDERRDRLGVPTGGLQPDDMDGRQPYG